MGLTITGVFADTETCSSLNKKGNAMEPVKSKGGRPRATDPYNKWMLRMKDSELERITEHATRRGMNRSEYIRHCVTLCMDQADGIATRTGVEPVVPISRDAALEPVRISARDDSPEGLVAVELPLRMPSGEQIGTHRVMTTAGAAAKACLLVVDDPFRLVEVEAGIILTDGWPRHAVIATLPKGIASMLMEKGGIAS